MIFKITCPNQISGSPNLYTLISIVAFIICLFITNKIYREERLNENANLFVVLIWIYPFFVFGSKIFSSLYYQEVNVISFHRILNSGMSIHGALLLSIFPLFIIKKLYDIEVLNLGSILLIPLGVGIFFIRVANTFNCELIGLASSKRSIVSILYIGKSLIPRFPIQLIEGILFLIFSLILIRYRKKLIVGGNAMKVFAVVFPGIRIITDRFKITPENLMENSIFLKSDILSAIFLLIAFSLIFQRKSRNQH